PSVPALRWTLAPFWRGRSPHLARELPFSRAKRCNCVRQSLARFSLGPVHFQTNVGSWMRPIPYDEMYAADGSVRPHYRVFASWLAETPAEHVARKRAEADTLFHRVGITFAVHGEEAGTERLIPFDIVPRIIPAAEW